MTPPILVRKACLDKLQSMKGEIAERLQATCEHILKTGDYGQAVRRHFVEERRILWAIFPDSPFAKKDGISLPEHLASSPIIKL